MNCLKHYKKSTIRGIDHSLVGPEGQQFDINDRRAILLVRWTKPTLKEIEEFGSGHKIEIRLTTVNDNMFLLFKFGNLNWFEAPYSPNLTYWTGPLQKTNQGNGYTVIIKLCDTNGIIYRLRLISFTTEFSNALRNQIIQQKQLNFNIQKYDAELEAIYRKYSTEDLVEMSSAGMILN